MFVFGDELDSVGKYSSLRLLLLDILNIFKLNQQLRLDSQKE